ncbi:MAG: ribosome small subunit-dependent GTPase A [Elusimicrobia bacterium RIFOXYB2_FULL_50_12]|nr:MAG: ribosome small subunit-dependent GTPase A [Elusimicrobia bacterium RIFOXYB2_FULL_50_12]
MASVPVKIEALGWNSFFSLEFDKLEDSSLLPGRVIAEYRGRYGIATVEGDFLGEISGKFFHQAKKKSDFPAVGDWVAIKRMPNTDCVIIHNILPRMSQFSRITKHARKDRDAAGEEQVVASNINTIFLMQGLDSNYNPRRIERFLVTIWDSGAKPVIILNKADMCDDPAKKVAETSDIAPGVPVHAISALSKDGIDSLLPYLNRGETVALIGSSGVGKSTLINTLFGKAVQKTAEVRLKDSRGRHTTSQRQIFILENGALLLDTPGIRGLELAETAHGIEDVFDDIEKLAAGCRFSDCRHLNETECVVQEAVRNGTLAPARLASYQKLERETEFIESKNDRNLMFKRKAREKILSREIKRLFKNRGK